MVQHDDDDDVGAVVAAGGERTVSGAGGSAAQGCAHAAFPFLQHPLAGCGALRMTFRVGMDFSCGLLNRFGNALQDLPHFRGRAAPPGFTELPQFLCRRPACRAVEGEGQAVLGKVHGRCHEIIDRRQPGFAQYVVEPDDPFPVGYTVGDIWPAGTVER